MTLNNFQSWLTNRILQEHNNIKPISTYLNLNTEELTNTISQLCRVEENRLNQPIRNIQNVIVNIIRHKFLNYDKTRDDIKLQYQKNKITLENYIQELEKITESTYNVTNIFIDKLTKFFTLQLTNSKVIVNKNGLYLANQDYKDKENRQINAQKLQLKQRIV